MIWIDYIITGIVFFSALLSLIRGFIRETFSLVIWACAFFIASYYYSYLAIYLTSFEKQIIRNGMAITLLFVATLIVGSILNYIIGSLVERTGFSTTDWVLGAFFGMLRGILIVSAALFFLDTFTSFSHSQDWQQSRLIPQFRGINRWFFNYLKSGSFFLPGE
ncbi:MAG: CvpA family protein [Sodalis sp. (in: enterobacteria)]